MHAGTHDSIFTPGGVIPATTALPSQGAKPTRGVTAVLVRARDISSAYQLYQSLNASTSIQAARPGAVLTQFLDYLGQRQRALSLVSGALTLGAVAGLLPAARAYRVDAAQELAQ